MGAQAPVFFGWGCVFPAGAGAKENTLRKKIEKVFVIFGNIKMSCIFARLKLCTIGEAISLFTYSVVELCVELFL